MKSQIVKTFFKPQFKIFYLSLLGILLISALVPSTLDDFFLPGSQPGQSGNLEHPNKCDNCHGGYDIAVEPAFNWRGSMMSQAARDPLFYACLAIANQDAPESGDLCIRCHSPAGWLEGRSVPTDGSALNNNDREGVQCDFCHKLVKPTPLGINPYPDDAFYTLNTYQDDQDYLGNLSIIPPQDGNGMYVADNHNAKRGPFADANAKHQMKYSPFHSDAAICGTCHDVSNPAYDRQADDTYEPNDFGAPALSFNTYDMFPIERTYSEWLMSSYNSPSGVYAPQFGGNKQYVSTCQDCHMKDVTGYGCNKNGVPLRNDLPLHDMTGGNTFIPSLVAQLYPSEVNPDALNAGVLRANGMLQKAATLEVTYSVSGNDYDVDVKVTNETGHKLPSGYPEGRRIWINMTAYSAGDNIVYESGAYDLSTATLIHDDDIKIYEIKPGIGSNIAGIVGLDPGPSFHFAINNQIFSDNRIPPRGFINTTFVTVQSPPVGYSYNDGQYWDNTLYQFTASETVTRISVVLYYQTLSKEYVEFLQDENVTNDAGDVIYNLWNNNGKSAPVVMNSVEINMAPPVADFSASPTEGYAPLEVTFTDLSTNAPTSWAWDFGDGNTSTAQNPVHTFTTPDTYTVTLTASNNFGSSTTSSQIIVNELTQPVIYVQNMDVYRVSMSGNRFAGECAVTIWDTGDNPVAGATVQASYDGPTAGNTSAITDGTGTAYLQSRATKNANGTWCFTITDVLKSGTLYDPGFNIETTDCESARNLNSASASVNPALSNLKILSVFPNPMKDRTQITFNLPYPANVKIEIYNASGQLIEILTSAILSAGDHTCLWASGEIPPGLYYVRLSSGTFTRSKVIVKRGL